MKNIANICGLLVISLVILAGVAPIVSGATPAPAVNQTPEAQATPPPEPPRQIANIEVMDDRLSVELENADFGAVIQSIGQKKGFTVDIATTVASRKITTKFQNVDFERGITRLFSVINEKNYLMHYGEKGQLSKIEVYGTASAPKQPSGSQSKTPSRQTKPTPPSSSTPQGQTSPTAPPGTPLPSRSRITPPASVPAPGSSSQTIPPAMPSKTTPATTQPAVPLPEAMSPTKNQQSEMPAPPQGNDAVTAPGPESLPQEKVEEIPYIAPQKTPVYIPSKDVQKK